MARKTASRMEMRREAEAAEASSAKKKTKKKATRKKATRKKAGAAVRRKLVWGIFSGSYKEEARFPYEQRKEAEEKLEALRNRSSKKLFFIQPIKENLGDTPEPPPVEDEEVPEDEAVATEVLEDAEDVEDDELEGIEDVEIDEDDEIVDEVDDEDEEMELPAGEE